MTTGIVVNRQSAHPAAQAAELGAGTVYTLLAALGFAAVSTLTTIAVGEHLSLWTVQMWRFIVASAALVTFVGVRNYPRMPWPEALRLMVIGGGGQALLLGLALSSLRFINVATLAFLFYTYPAWVALVQTVRGAERLTARRVLALALSFGGIGVIVLRPAFVAAASGVPWKGVALALGAAVVYGLYIPAVQWLQKSHPVPVTSAYIKLGTAVCFLFVALGDGSLTVSLTPTAWTAIVTLALFSTVMPGLLFLMGLMRLGPVRTAIISTVEPFLTALLGAVVLRQAITVTTVLGGAMIVGAVLVLQIRRERVA
ncbi:MAG TPA: DMT family transporter [Gemmatimonadaceae bacterium]|nr:DMT family transporter [Gemmatimonadaceae bacterium]